VVAEGVGGKMNEIKPTHFKIELMEATKPYWIGMIKIMVSVDGSQRNWKVIHLQNTNNKECFDELKKIEGVHKV
jgi:hypothetical protein